MIFSTSGGKAEFMIKSNSKYKLNIPDTSKPRLIIAGGGFGGLNLLKKLDRDLFQVVIFDRYNYHTFQPLLYQVATAGLEPDSVAGPLRKIIRKNDEIYFRMLRVTSVNPEKKIVSTDAGQLSYDYLVIATGSKINYFGNDKISRYAFPLKQITHALDLRSHIFQQLEKLEISDQENAREELLNFVIVGAGPTGVELCGALAELKSHVLPRDYPDLDVSKMKIFLIEGLERVLPAMSEKSGKRAQQYLEDMGVSIRLNTMTKDFDGRVVSFDSGEKIHTTTLVWAAGVKGNILEGFSEKSIIKGKYAVNAYNQIIRDRDKNQAYQHSFALGDAAFMKTEDYPDGLPGLAQPAIQQGKHIAKNLRSLVRNQKPRKFSYKNKGVLATVGRNKAVAELPNAWIGGGLGWFIWIIIHLLFLVGFRNRAIVLANWTWNYFTYDRGIRLILRPSSKDHDPVSQGMSAEMKESFN
jgi:NADH dehydrogenase